MRSVDPRQLCQIMIPTRDHARALQFYTQVFGWNPVPADIYQLTILEVPKDCPFGIALVEDRELRPTVGAGPILIFAVEDPQSLLDRYRVHRGWSDRDQDPTPTLHPGYGRVWHVTDPDGHVWGLFGSSAARAPTP